MTLGSTAYCRRDPRRSRLPSTSGAFGQLVLDRLHLSTHTAAWFARTVIQLHHDGNTRCSLRHRVNAFLDDGHDLVPLTLDVGEHGVGLIGEATRPDDADCFGHQGADRPVGPNGPWSPSLTEALDHRH